MSDQTGNTHTQQNGGLSLTPADVYFIIFRHKWKIFICTLLGLALGATAFLVFPESYVSRAKLFIRYVQESSGPTSFNDDSNMKSPDSRGDTIINSEIMILTSLDLAREVASEIGPEKIIEKPEKGDHLTGASIYIQNNLTPEVPRKSSVINVLFEHKDSEVVQSTLQAIVDSYFRRHLQVHRAAGTFDDFLTQQTDQLRARLNQTEEELRKALNKAGVVSIIDARANYNQQRAQTRQELFAADADLAANQAALKQLKNRFQSQSEAPQEDGTEASPEETAANNLETHNNASSYASLLAQLDRLQQREESLLLQFTPENKLVRSVSDKIATLESEKRALEQDHPEVVSRAQTLSPRNYRAAADPSIDLLLQETAVASLEARIATLRNQLIEIDQDSAKIDNIEVTIQELQRRRELEETNYKYFAANLEQARIDEALGAGRVNNISLVESPTPPFIAESKKLPISAGAAASGLVLSLLWAFVAELFLDRTIKRSGEMEKLLKVPLFLSIPDNNQKVPKRVQRAREKKLLNSGSTSARTGHDGEPFVPVSPTLRAAAKSHPETFGNVADKNDAPPPTAWEQDPSTLPYYEALRDRVIGFFESRGLAHKPKLIGLTGLGEQPGVTTLSYGLASCLSQTGEGNVLLVDMTLGHESAQQFYNGKEVCDIDEALKAEEGSQLNGNLYLASEGTNGYKIPKILPNRFNHLVPKMKASDFDYIIFDMPEISPISVTPRLSRFMDAMLVVIEAEKTDKDVAKQALELLESNNNNVGTVLNKTRRYVPRFLSQDFQGLS